MTKLRDELVTKLREARIAADETRRDAWRAALHLIAMVSIGSGEQVTENTRAAWQRWLDACAAHDATHAAVTAAWEAAQDQQASEPNKGA